MCRCYWSEKPVCKKKNKAENKTPNFSSATQLETISDPGRGGEQSSW